MSTNHNFAKLEMNAMSRLLVDTAPSGIIVCDADGTILTANPQAVDWLGYSEDELLGRQVEVLIPESSRFAHVKYRAQFMRNPTPRSMAAGQDLAARRKDGSHFLVDVSLHPIEFDSRRLVLVNLRDASQRSGAEEGKQDRESERLATIKDVANGLAHECRNTLQRAQAYLDLLKLDSEVETKRDTIDKLNQAFDDLYRHYEKVKSFASPIVLNYRESNLIELCEEAFAELRADYGGDGHQLMIDGNRESAVAKVDPRWMKRLFRNVLENSIAASPTGSEVTTTAAPTWLAGQPAIRVDIWDNGDGLDPQTESRLFEPFYTTKQHGLGLGLAFCRRIIDAHQGRIKATNSPDGGALVEVVVPRRLE